MGIVQSKLCLSPTTLKGEMVQLARSIALLVSTGFGSHTTTTKINFLVVKTHSFYNNIIGRPTLNSLKAITSTHQLMIKFSTEIGIGEVCGEQVLVRECYIQELKGRGKGRQSS